MPDKSHPVLISIKAFAGNGGELLRKAIKELDTVLEISAISSIYSVAFEENQANTVHDLRTRGSYSGLVVSLKGLTTSSPENLLEHLKHIESSLAGTLTQQSLQLKLQIYEDLTIMRPDLTIPHPEFHLRADEVVPAAEIWSEYIHPISKQSMFTLTQRFSGENWGEFFGQGKSLLDF